MKIYLNGEIVSRGEARIDPFDRGFLFGDGVYEGLRAFGGRVVGLDGHVARLARGLAATRISWDASRLGEVCDRVLAANGLADAFIYVQVTRGAPGAGEAVRSRVMGGTAKPTVFAYASPTPGLNEYAQPPTKTAITTEDTRWLRGLIKSVSLMGGVLAAYEAHEAGADDAILIRTMPGGERLAAEGTSANLIAVIPKPGESDRARGSSLEQRREGKDTGGTPVPRDEEVEIVTPPLDGAPILAGVTRGILLAAAAKRGIPVRERNLSERELLGAREVMLCGTLTMVTAITRLNAKPVGDGTPGPEARRLLRVLVEAIGEGA